MLRLRTIMISLLGFAGVLSLGAGAYLQHPKFGAYPEGERLEKIQRSPHFADGEFRNLLATPMFAGDSSFLSVLVGNLSQRAKNLRPNGPIPATKTDLKSLDTGLDTVVWLGHSSYFVLFAGKRILIDPVFSTYASPLSFVTKAFDGTNLYAVDDIPKIDVLLITHDHWDHLDHATVTELEPKVGRVFVPLGVGAHFERWSYAREKIHEADWFGKLELNDGLAVYAVPARHYSGRLLTRNKTLWAGFVLESKRRRILFGGDSGYGPHFVEIARRFGGFDLVAMDMGQYDARWPLIHMTPEEAVRAAMDLQAKTLLPAHVGRFNIARHAWNEPFDRIVAASKDRPFRLMTPMIGEPLILDHEGKHYSRWWTGSERTAAAIRSVDVAKSQ